MEGQGSYELGDYKMNRQKKKERIAIGIVFNT